MGFTIDYCAARVVEMKTNNYCKTNKGKEKINVAILTKCHAYIEMLENVINKIDELE